MPCNVTDCIYDFEGPPLKKRESEELVFSINYASRLETGESLTGTPTITPDTDSGITADSITIVGDKVQALFSGGEAALEPWNIVVTVVIDSANPDQTFVDNVKLKILADDE